MFTRLERYVIRMILQLQTDKQEKMVRDRLMANGTVPSQDFAVVMDTIFKKCQSGVLTSVCGPDEEVTFGAVPVPSYHLLTMSDTLLLHDGMDNLDTVKRMAKSYLQTHPDHSVACLIYDPRPGAANTVTLVPLLHLETV